jgi:imidazolonepropionase-like amidohydrolase
VIEDATVVVRDGRIAAVGPATSIKVPTGKDVTVIECRGATITAGFWNSHVHIFTEDLLDAKTRPSSQLTAAIEQMLTRWGFTTVFDVASVLDNTNEIRRRIASGEVRGPRILTVGEPFYPKGGTPVYIQGFIERHHIASAEVSTPAEAVARVRRQIAHGADGIKIFAGAITAKGVLPMPLDIAKAMVEEAHKAGKPVFAHPSNQEGLDVALQSGVDILAHTAPMSGDWTPAFVAKLNGAHMALIPTLTLFDVEAKKARVSEEENEKWIAKGVQELKAFVTGRGQVLFGTDVGYTDHFDTAEEYTLMARAGMDYRQILASLTTNPATRFHDTDRGRVAKGMKADLVVLEADPAADVTAFAKVRKVIRAGTVIYFKH